jgi:hypothetical protein
MAPKIKDLISKYNISEEDQIVFGLKRTPMLSGRVTQTEKKEFVKLCRKQKSNQSEIFRKEVLSRLKDNDINWDQIKILKGTKRSYEKEKTVPVRIKVSEDIENKISSLCEENEVTVSSFVRYIVLSYIKQNEG